MRDDFSRDQHNRALRNVGRLSALCLTLGVSAGLINSVTLVGAAWADSGLVGLECHLTQLRPIKCAQALCPAQAFDETHWYVVDAAHLRILEFGKNGVPLSSSFRHVTITAGKHLSAEGGHLGPGATSLTYLSYDLVAKTGGLSVLIQGGGEFGPVEADANILGGCVERSAHWIAEDRTQQKVSE